MSINKEIKMLRLVTLIKRHRNLYKYLVVYPAKKEGLRSKTYLGKIQASVPYKYWIDTLENNMVLPEWASMRTKVEIDRAIKQIRSKFNENY